VTCLNHFAGKLGAEQKCQEVADILLRTGLAQFPESQAALEGAGRRAKSSHTGLVMLAIVF